MSDFRTRVLRVGTRALSRLIPSIRSFLYRRKRLSHLVQRLLDRLLPLQDAFFALAQGDPRESYEMWIAAYDTVDETDLSAMRDEQARGAESPLLSLVVGVAQMSEAMLEAFAKSLFSQVYERWEVGFVGNPLVNEGAGTSVAEVLMRDGRFRPFPERAESLADAWNAALRSAASESLVLIDPRVMLRPHALFVLARTIERYPDAVLIYADEDLIDEAGSRSRHYFKPDWNEALLRSQNYFGGFVFLDRAHALAVGGCHDEFDGDCAWGLFLRLTAVAPPSAIRHVPYILSHRRAGQSAPESDDGGRRERVAEALEERLARIGERAHVEPVGESSYRRRHMLPEKPPKVSIIVPSTCRLEFLRPCLDGLLNRTSYPELEVLIVVNGIGNITGAQREYLEAVAARPEIRLLFPEPRPYNFSRLNNWAAQHARGTLLCFLNDDTDVIGTDWLSAMVAHIVQDRVAAVGAMLVYPNGRIQHAGVVLGAGNVAAHNYSRRPGEIRGYHDRALVDQDVSCVTAACMLVRRDVFLDVGGFDEALAIAFNDVDFCLKLRRAGWRIVWTPNAKLYHRESASIGRHDVGERGEEWAFELELMYSRWGETLTSDPHYSPNLSSDPLKLWEPAFPPRIFYSWKSGSSNRRIGPQATVSSAGSSVSAGRGAA